MLKIQTTSIHFSSFEVLREIDLSFNQGENILIMGTNGSGKSTLLKYMLGLLPNQTGEVLYQGISLLSDQKFALSDEFGVFFPEYRVYDFLTVQENLEVFALYQGLDDVDYGQKMADFHISDFARVKARNLSLGNYKKLCLAVSLLGNPKLMVLDEPFLGVDKVSIPIILATLQRMQQENGALTLLTTHELEPVEDWYTRAMYIQDKKIHLNLTKAELSEQFGTLANFQHEIYA